MGDLNLDANNGDIFQNSDAAVIVGGDTDIMASGHICLTGGDNDGDGINDNSFTGDIQLDAVDGVTLATTGTLDIDSGVVSGSSLRFIADEITISTDITADQLLLEATNGVSLNDAFFVDVSDLLLSGTGNFDLASSAFNTCLLYTSPSPRDRG